MSISKIFGSTVLIIGMLCFSQACEAQITGAITPNPYKTGDLLEITPSVTAETPPTAAGAWIFSLVVQWDGFLTGVGEDQKMFKPAVDIVDTERIDPGGDAVLSGPSNIFAPDVDTYGCKVVLGRWTFGPGGRPVLVPVGDSAEFDASREEDEGDRDDRVQGSD